MLLIWAGVVAQVVEKQYSIVWVARVQILALT